MTVPATPGLEWLSTSRQSNMGRRGTEEAAVVCTCPFGQSISRTLLWHLDLRSRFFWLRLSRKALILCM